LLMLAVDVAAGVVVARAMPRARVPAVVMAAADLDSLNVRAVSIPEERTFGGKVFPFTVSPKKPEGVALADWAVAHRDEILQLIEEHDAVLLRGFGKATEAMDFSEFCAALQLGSFDMGCSAAPRTNVAPGVFTANEAPPSEPIPFHHEMAQCDEFPSYVFFYCQKPAVERGATPIIPSNACVEHLETNYPGVADRLRANGVRYVRTLPEIDDPNSPIGKSWKKSFEAETREEAEAVMREAGTSFTWSLSTTQDEGSYDVKTVSAPRTAIKLHQNSGREMFFNSVIAARDGWVDVRNDPSKAIVYGDGTELDDEAQEALDSVADYMENNKVAFGWEAGDVLLIDNHKALHSRETFVAPRRVLASLWAEPLEQTSDAQQTREADLDAAVRAAMPMRTDGQAAVKATKAQPTSAQASAVRSELFMRLRGGGATAARAVTNAALTLRTGASMPAIGLGLWKVPKDVTATAVVDAIRMGYRHLDSACDYGNEKQVGEGIARAISEGLVTREELWITSKLWNTYHAKEHVEPACRKTLADLGLDYVDLYLVHFPISLKFVPFETRYPPEWVYDPDCAEPKMELVDVPVRETWEAMEALVPLGLAKNIGVCNFNTAGLRDMLSYAKVPPAVLQVELHLYNQQPQLVRYAAEAGLAVTGFSPLGSGSYVELDMATPQETALSDPAVVALAEAHGVSPAQVLLKWALQRGISAIPKSSKPERLLQNIELDGFELSDEQMASLAKLDKGKRYNDPGVFCLGMGAFCPIYD